MNEINIGDWVRTISSTRIFQVGYIGRDSYYTEDRLKSVKFDKAELWVPNGSELCYFYNDKDRGEVVLGKFCKMDEGYFVQYIDTISTSNELMNIKLEEKVWKFCEPFTGSVPSHLKETE